MEQVQCSLRYTSRAYCYRSGPQVAASTTHLPSSSTSSWARGTAQALLVSPVTSTTVFLTSLGWSWGQQIPSLQCELQQGYTGTVRPAGMTKQRFFFRNCASVLMFIDVLAMCEWWWIDWVLGNFVCVCFSPLRIALEGGKLSQTQAGAIQSVGWQITQWGTASENWFNLLGRKGRYLCPWGGGQSLWSKVCMAV